MARSIALARCRSKIPNCVSAATSTVAGWRGTLLGVAGNIPRGALAVMKTSIPYVARVSNRAAAVGGRDAQSLDDARLRVPQILRTRQRAVTADDYEFLAAQVKNVARAYCLAPGAQPGQPSAPAPGHVTILVLPQIE